MSRNTVNTVLGEMNIQDLGQTLCHEHVICFTPAMKMGFDDRWFDTEQVIQKATVLFKHAKEECGVTTMIDGTPLDLGRDVDMMVEVSRRSGVNIIASTGIYHNEELFLAGKKPEKFAKYFIEDWEKGIGNTGIKPGILKCATGQLGFTDINKMLINTMAIVQRETGLPLFAHNTHELKTPYEQIRIFEANGVNLEKVIIGHCSDSYDPDYLEDLLKCGCYLGFDRIYPHAYKEQAGTMAELIRRGWGHKLLVSHDYFAFIDFGDTDWETQRNEETDRSFTIVHKLLFPALRELGITEEQIGRLTTENIRTLFG